MLVTVEGVITSIEQKEKDGKKNTELLLAQKGQKTQVTVRIDGWCEENYTLFQVEMFSGRLMTWTTRNGVGSMVMVENDDARAS